MSVTPVSILSSEQVVNVKYMFDETIIEKLNLLMHSHAIAEKDTKQHRELANFKERCVDDHGKDKSQANKWLSNESLKKVNLETLPTFINNNKSKYKQWLD